MVSDLTDKRFDLCQFLDFANTPGTDGLFFNPDDKVTFFQCHTNATLTGDLLISKLRYVEIPTLAPISPNFAKFRLLKSAKVGLIYRFIFQSKKPQGAN